MKTLKRQRPFLQKVLNSATRHKREALIQHTNADQINALSEMSLNLLKRHIPIKEKTRVKLKRHKNALRKLGQRRLVDQLQRQNLACDADKRRSHFWQKSYQELLKEYQALKYGQLCVECQSLHLLAQKGAVEDRCEKCRRVHTSWHKRVEDLEQKVNYWQRCYETLLEKHYG